MKEFVRELGGSFLDRRLLALLLIVSPLVLLLFGYAARSGVDSVEAVVFGPGAERVEQELPSFFEIVEADTGKDRGAAVTALRDGKSDVAVVAERQPELLINGVSLFEARSVKGIAEQASALGSPKVLFNPELSLTISLLPAVSGLVLLVVSALALSGPLARDRETGRFARLSRSPGKLAAAAAGKALFWLTALVVVAVVVESLNRILFDLPYRADLSTTFAVCGVFAFCALGIGVLISSLARTRGKAIALSVGLIVPQILLSGAIFPIQSVAPGLRPVTQALPMTYVVELSRGAMLRGSSIEGLGQPLVALGATGLLTLTVGLSILALQVRTFRRSESYAYSFEHESERTLSRA